jgi:phosphoribosyl 1,2-cyclic phosphate phosphodiesterase
MRSNYARCKKDVCRLSLTDHKHNRTRSSILIEYNGKYILVDVSADFREQTLRERVPRIDAVLITHCHSDHINGIPDIRSYNDPSPHALDFYGSAESMNAIEQSFSYIFSAKTFVGGGIPRLALHEAKAQFQLFGLPIVPIPVVHGTLQGCLGYRIGNIGYIPDVKSIPETSMRALSNLDCLILDCLRDTREHSTHVIMEESLRIARDLAPVKCYFIHMSHDIHYQLDADKLEPWMQFSWDGMKIEVELPITHNP